MIVNQSRALAHQPAALPQPEAAVSERRHGHAVGQGERRVRDYQRVHRPVDRIGVITYVRHVRVALGLGLERRVYRNRVRQNDRRIGGQLTICTWLSRWLVRPLSATAVWAL